MFEKLARRNKSITRDDFVGSNKEAAAGFSSVASPKYEKGAFVWRDRDEVKTGRWRTRWAGGEFVQSCVGAIWLTMNHTYTGKRCCTVACC